MTRFCLAIGPDVDQCDTRLRERLAPFLPEISKQQGAILFYEQPSDLVVLPVVEGWIIGKIFAARDARPIVQLEPHTQLALSSTRGRALLEKYFGSYLAIWRDGPDRPWNALRDPSSTQPVLYHQGRDLTLFASDFAILEATGLIHLGVDWPSIAHQLRFPQVPTARTGLTGITELLPGACLRIASEIPVTELLWKPWTFRSATRDAVASQNRLDDLAAIIDRVVVAQVAGADRVGLELSGGLDSSILAAALDRASARWTGITFATRAADGDERRYARLVADRFAVPLIEAIIGDDAIIALDAPRRRTERPGGTGFLAGLDRILQTESDAAKANLMVSGAGGDNVFCSIGSTAPVIDAWRAGGLPLARRAFGDVAATSDSTHWQVGRALILRVLRDSLRRRRWPPQDRFLARHVRPAPDRHPWLDLPPRSPPGLRAHIAAVLRIHMVLAAHDRFVTRRYAFPLLSQPVLETCLAIPSWQWLAGGRDRSVARAAFADRLPAEILNRTRKGRVESLMVRAYDRARPELAALLHDGLLRGAGLLDMPAIEACLREHARAGAADYARILALADAELWARAILGSGGG